MKRCTTTLGAALAGFLFFSMAVQAAQAQDLKEEEARPQNSVAAGQASGNAPTAQAAGNAPVEKKAHRLVLQVNSNEPGLMNLALNNAANVASHYKELGEKVEIEIVAYGPGLHMMRDDTSPVKSRIKSMSQSTPSVSFKACLNTQENMKKTEERDIPIVSEASIVKSGVVRIMELQEQGWTYVRP